ncbi:unnamed protein product [Trichobilharzia regenti]|nr:unnamed protein product [Trichobilharzia regenti]
MSTSNGDYVRIPLSGSFDDQVDSEPQGNLEHEVLARLASAVVPNPRTNFIQNSLKPRADLYGPFWIATTLMMASAIGGNVSNYLQSRGEVSSWHYDFQKVTLTSTVIYVYWCLTPLVLHGLMYFRRNSVKSQSNNSESDLTDLLERSDSDSSFRNSKRVGKFFDILSTYGYSLTIFVPVAVSYINILLIVLPYLC